MPRAEEILSKPFGARYWRVDLHVHTPGSRDTHVSSRSLEPDDVVVTAIDRGLDVVAVTDHNSVEWCESVMEAARGTDLFVLPGVEISTREGHVLAVFDRDKPVGELRELLVTQGIREADFGNLDAIANAGIDDVARAVVAEGGVAIAAHVSAPRGFLTMAQAGARRDEIHGCEELAAFETHDLELARQLLDGDSGRYPRAVACVQGSDSWTDEGEGHRVEGIGLRHCYIKMDGVSTRGLSQAFIDPDVRVRAQTEVPTNPIPFIEGFVVGDGFLQNQPLRFNPNITCLIGGTGAGKSASVEIIRFALDQQVDASVLPAVRREVDSLLSFALRESTTVSVLLRKADDLYLVERVWLPGTSTPPTVHRVGSEGTIGDLVDGVHLPTFFPVKAFSQGEIIEYAREPLARLTLLDDLLDLDLHHQAVIGAKGRLRENAGQLLEAERRLAAAREQLEELPTIQEQIRGLDRFFADERVRDHPIWYQERAILDAASESVQQLERDAVAEFPELQSSWLSQVPATPKNQDMLDELRALDSEIRTELATRREEIGEAVSGFASRLSEIRGTWDGRFRQADRVYRQLLVELDRDGFGRTALATKLEELRTREQRLLQLKEAVESRHMPAVEELRRERDSLLDELQAGRRLVTVARQDKARELTARLEDRVRIRVSKDGDGRGFLDALKAIRVGSRVRDEELEAMANELHPVPFVKSLIARDFAVLASKSNLEERVFERLADNIVEKGLIQELYELQLVDLNDVVRVQFAVEASKYRELEALAHGQKCTVVLMISLAEGDAPLLVDQPEDALHAPWIEEYIVSRLRGDRGMRQCLFATRSANVLVSADAEQILAMESDAGRGWLRESGSIDRFDTRDLVVYHVEGGEKPFTRRRLKYGL